MRNHRLLGFGLTAALLLSTGAAFSAPKGKPANNPPPITIESEGGFSFAGKVDTDPTGTLSRHCDHGYANFSIPVNARQLPIVMWHSTHVKTWTSNPSFLGGHQSFQDIFLRRGFGVYVIDPPRQGDANYACVDANYVQNWSLVGTDQSTFNNWRLGTWNPPSPPTPFPNNQLLDDPNGRLLDQILRARYPDNEQLPDAFPLEADAVASLLEDVGPSILFTHSGSGRPGWLTVFKTPKVAAVVDFEASVYAFPTGELPPGSTGQLEVPLADFLKLTKIPILVIFGDNLNGAWPPRLANAKAFVDKVNEHGGNAKLIHLPEIGIVGNSHIMMLEKNNAQIADVVSDWFKDNGLDKH